MQEHISNITEQTLNQLTAKKHATQRYSVTDESHAPKNMTNPTCTSIKHDQYESNTSRYNMITECKKT